MESVGNPYDKAHELARAITNSEVYKRYVEAKTRVGKNPQHQELIAKIRNRQMEVNRAKILGQEVPSEAAMELSRFFAEVNQIGEIAEFFNRESSFIQLFNDIMAIIQKTVEKGFDADKN
ncbi:MAG: YlbF family regulator [Syntrophomonadaceae bacterium]|jgi:cell fate (sporulation/competence/biofilm development) regulator YlbF (YheA/YmcA/DUF963 family)